MDTYHISMHRFYLFPFLLPLFLGGFSYCLGMANARNGSIKTTTTTTRTTTTTATTTGILVSI